MTDRKAPRYLIPPDWRSRPELVPVLRLLVEGARRAVQGSNPYQPKAGNPCGNR